ncbi:WLM domain-domain-containing protein [Protomyces lactucae-debilis]|uniref:WLM domain-domain-containing protein n=1 Tax=Protomyces lactucae-debilis TaxID=2754530 RepID=A0A1Y2FDD2_PROLT|nr:WLM domain-containing protein [Protomyces lactucae-debilis]ORY81931.1 WLM domain-domain-containing protein [Protomyces lactucae-debilis]
MENEAFLHQQAKRQRKQRHTRRYLLDALMSEAKLIGTFVHLKKKPDAERAQKTLQRVANHVMPILKARSWRVRTLAEFYPEQKNLLGTNLNRGQKISLRLRQPFDDSSHLEFEDVMGTMLHELAHIVRGPHDEQFYRVLDSLNLEYDALLSSSAGKFLELGEGKTLGGRAAGPTQQEIRKAAERRKRGTGPQGQKVGGALSGMLSANQRAAEAAQRRLFDAKWCGHGRAEDPVLVDEEEEISNDESLTIMTDDTKAKRPIQAQSDIIIIESDEETPKLKPALQNPNKKRRRADENGDYARMKQRGLIRDTLQDHLAKLAADKATKSGDKMTTMPLATIPGRWFCGICTLANKLGDAYCDACGTERPSGANRLGQHWLCEGCLQMNEKSMWMCIRNNLPHVSILTNKLGCQAIKKSS